MRTRSLVFVGVVVMSACNPEPQACTAGEQSCEGVCTDFSSSAQHCGSCDHACENGERCVSGECVSRCTVPGGFVDAGVIDGCLVCEPIRSSTALSPREDGVSCATGLCHAGQCEASCIIDGQFIGNGSLNGANPCERCDLSVSAISWAVNADGTGCGGAQICQSGVCSSGCFIGGVLYAPGTVNSLNACEACEPASSTTGWTTRSDGASCGNAQVCQSGACGAGCFIDGVSYATGTLNPANVCQQCAPGLSTLLWSTLDDGVACGAGQVCAGGSCTAGCFIANAFIDAGSLNALNACERCDTTSSTTGWSVLADGTSCGSGVCVSDACVGRCFIDAGFVDAGTPDPSNLCRACLPAISTSDYSPRGSATLLQPGTSVASQGWSMTGVGTRSLTDDGGVITLTTSTVSNTGGQQLLYRRIAPSGGPFTLRVEWRVDAVNAHNQFDSAAAILGRFDPTSIYGDNIDRSQMVYLDAARVGWADDTQFAAINNLDGGFHVYELAIDADAGARFSVDGAPQLSRGNFSTNGVIALGDQSNDPNIESTLSLRSVTLICQ